MNENKSLADNFYNNIIKKNIIKDLKILLEEYQFGNRSDWPEDLREDNIRNIKAQLWEWGVSKKDLKQI